MKPPPPSRSILRRDSDEALAARVCWYHYKEGLTQQETADRVGLSRASVNKIISDARASGLVRIEIDNRLSPCLDLERRLVERFGLKQAVVVPGPAREKDAYLVVGLATGDHISGALAPGAVLGMTWGSTLHFAARSLIPRTGAGNTVVSLCGGLPRSMIINPYDNASTFARILDAACYYMTAPLIVEDRRLKDALLSSESVATVLDMASRIDLCVLTVTDLSQNSMIMQHGVLTQEMRQSLLDAGSVGAICDHYIDRDGRLVDHSINERTVSVPLELVGKIPVRVLAGGGSYKVDILRACLNAGICNVLVTEERAAQGLLKPA
jgi:DNA-binding transcriptional regulator LsrR (DeoR family)